MTYKEQLTTQFANKKVVVWISLLVMVSSAAIGLYKQITDLLPSSKGSYKATAESITKELQKISSMTPVQQSFEDCLEKRTAKNTFDVLEKCMRERKETGNDARQLIKSVIQQAKMNFPELVFSEVQAHLLSMDYLIYEMQNNQTTIEYWYREGCSDGIKITKSPPLPSAQESANIPVRCILAIQSSEEFLSRASKGTDRVSGLVKSFGALEEFEFYVSQGIQENIRDFMKYRNNSLVDQYLQHEGAVNTSMENLYK